MINTDLTAAAQTIEYGNAFEGDLVTVGEAKRYIAHHSHGKGSEAFRVTVDAVAVRVSQIEVYDDSNDPVYGPRSTVTFLNAETGEELRKGWTSPSFDCTICGKCIQSNEIEGTTDTSRRCDSRCEAATGKGCRCQCGGKNHGMMWLAA